MNTNTQIKLLVISGAVIIVIFVLFAACFGLIFKAVLNNMLVIEADKSIFNQFTSPSTPIYMDFYFFNVTNYEEVQKYGEKPNLTEVGPYVYEEKYLKYDFEFDDNGGTVSYYQNKTYFFNSEKSIGNERDLITTLNAALVLVAATIQEVEDEHTLSGETEKAIKAVWGRVEDAMDLFDKFTVAELLFEGWELPKFNFDFSNIPFCKKCSKTEGLNGTLYEMLEMYGITVPYLEANRFSLFYGTNGTNDGRYKVETGAAGMDEYLYIVTWKNASNLNYWNDSYCDMINGTDGTQFPPGVDNQQTIRLYTSDLCRSMYLEYEREMTVQEVLPSLRFIATEEMLQSPYVNTDNYCYCVLIPGDTACLNSSMLNLAPCTGAPIVLSTPHFYEGESQDVNNFNGLNPSKEKHETFLDIEPISGVVVEAAKRIQLNLPLRHFADLSTFKNVPEVIFPIVWADENAQISESDAQTFNKVLTLPFIIAYTISGALILLGLILLLVGLRKRRRYKCSYVTPAWLTTADSATDSNNYQT